MKADPKVTLDAALRYGTPHSPEYRAGMLAAYTAKLAGVEILLLPYTIATAAADATAHTQTIYTQKSPRSAGPN
jgi:hypothetical protein